MSHRSLCSRIRHQQSFQKASSKNARELPHMTSRCLANSCYKSILSRSDFERCRQTLIQIFRRCSDLEFLHLSIIVSCLLHSIRPLHKSEFATIVRASCTRVIGYAKPSISDEETWDHLPVQGADLFITDSSGNIDLAQPTMREFLRTCPIKGIDRSQLTLAKACIAQALLDNKVQLDQTRDDTVERSFSSYAQQNWYKHYQHVQGSAPELIAQVHQLLCGSTPFQFVSISSTPGSKASARHLHIERASTFCQDHSLHVLHNIYRQLLSQRSMDSYQQGFAPNGSSNDDVIGLSRDFASLSTDVERSTIDSEDWVFVNDTFDVPTLKKKEVL